MRNSLYTDTALQEQRDAEYQSDYSTSGSDVFESNALADWAQASGFGGFNLMSLVGKDGLSSTSDEDADLPPFENSLANKKLSVGKHDEQVEGTGSMLSNSTLKVLQRNKFVQKGEVGNSHIEVDEDSNSQSHSLRSIVQEPGGPPEQGDLLKSSSSSQIIHNAGSNEHLESPTHHQQQSPKCSRSSTNCEDHDTARLPKPIWVSMSDQKLEYTSGKSDCHSIALRFASFL